MSPTEKSAEEIVKVRDAVLGFIITTSNPCGHAERIVQIPSILKEAAPDQWLCHPCPSAAGPGV